MAYNGDMDIGDITQGGDKLSGAQSHHAMNEVIDCFCIISLSFLLGLMFFPQKIQDDYMILGYTFRSRPTKKMKRHHHSHWWQHPNCFSFLSYDHKKCTVIVNKGF